MFAVWHRSVVISQSNVDVGGGRDGGGVVKLSLSA